MLSTVFNIRVLRLKSIFFCWKCCKELSVEKVSFRLECPFCGTDQHTCKNCRFYEVGKPNDCKVPGTDPIRDREARNFCEEYKTALSPPSSNSNPSRFDSLFKKPLE